MCKFLSGKKRVAFDKKSEATEEGVSPTKVNCHMVKWDKTSFIT